MDFKVSGELRELRDRVRAFIAEQVIPLENDERPGAHWPSESLRAERVGRARAAGLLTPHASVELGAWGWATSRRPWCSRRRATPGLGPRRSTFMRGMKATST